MEHITIEKVAILGLALWALIKFVNRPTHTVGTRSRGYTNVSPHALSDSAPGEAREDPLGTDGSYYDVDVQHCGTSDGDSGID
ncbi:hypothetical protein [Leisingera caerulea]|uniref:hypothetical protein n=1 Tax=Leisingera caerulea TaxID=506591 RepID=UPI0021A377C4|nr:hypothetical protein [Leisingera caerulea]UWQ50283.1 hypothetical protein K3720_02425 [Leisingera caerulea]UWQ84012.1 hypothetical protein K3726_02090 [Leisingera caerulea]